jgi:hypothetical protein
VAADPNEVAILERCGGDPMFVALPYAVWSSVRDPFENRDLGRVELPVKAAHSSFLSI